MKAKEKAIVMAVFGALVEEHDFSELNAAPFRLGSITIEGMTDLYYRLKYEDFCKRRGIKYEEMTDEDYVDYAYALGQVDNC